MSPVGVYEHQPRLGARPGVGPLAAEFRRALVARRMTQRELADITFLSRDSIVAIAAGRVRPRHATVVRLADALSWPRLIDISAKQRLAACVVCRRAMVAEGTRPRLYCTDSCMEVAHARRRRDDRAFSGVIARHQLAIHQSAVDDMCRQCAPELVCRVADCPLRPVSPFPLVTQEARA